MSLAQRASGANVPRMATTEILRIAAFATPNAKGNRHRSTEGAEGANKGHENAEGMAFVVVRLTAQLGWWQVR